KHTTHFCAADADGNWVSCTATINTSFGSKVVIPGTGVIMNNEMDDFSAQPGAPNFFGLVGAEANAIAPGKRPLSSMSPTIISKHGEPILALGAAGGPTIISQVVLTIINFVDLQMPLADALKTPRFHHQWNPDELKIEMKWAPSVMDDLEKRGHKLNKVTSFGACQAIARNRDGKGFIGVPDPRGSGKAEVW
ncbi:MAG: gamma-glutamyltransferase, partial [Limisphaerales bacterium]